MSNEFMRPMVIGWGKTSGSAAVPANGTPMRHATADKIRTCVDFSTEG